MTPDEKHPMMEAKEIAEILGWSVTWFRQKRKQLIATEGMPAPLPGGRWRRENIERWLDTYGQLKAKDAKKSLSQIRVQWDRDMLEQKYARAVA